MNALDVIMDEMMTLKPSRYDANSYIILSLRNIKVLIDGMKCLFNGKNSEASQVLLRGLFEVSIQLIYFVYEPSLIEENNAIYHLCHARDLEKQLDDTYTNYDDHNMKKEILSIRKEFQETYEKIQELGNKKSGSWYKIAGRIREQQINTLSDLCDFLKLESNNTKPVLYKIIYKLTSAYIHGQTMADVVYKVDSKLTFLPIQYLKSSGLYLLTLYYIMYFLLPKLIYYCKLQNISLMDLCSDDLNMQKERIEKIREFDEQLMYFPIDLLKIIK